MASDPRLVAKDIVRTLREAGHLGYFAGGCVRDELLGLHPKDYDVATEARPEQVAALFRRVREVGRSFGVMLVHRSGVTVEVTTFRREGVYSDKRRPDEIEFCDARSDAERRDFTVNALYIDPLVGGGDEVIDYVGGRVDLERRILRAVGDPDQRLAEDHLRALRAVRFTARLGFEIEPATRESIVRHASELAGVSRERIGDELRMMLAHETRATAIQLIQDLGLDAPVLDEPTNPGAGTRILASLPARASVPLALAAWGADRAGGVVAGVHAQVLVKGWRRAICLSNAERDSLSRILTLTQRLEANWNEMSMAQRKRSASSRAFGDALALLGAASPDRAEMITADVGVMRASPLGVEPAPLVSGEDLIAAGLEPGPNFTRWLEAAYDAQLEGRISTLEQGIALIRELASASDEGPSGRKSGS